MQATIKNTSLTMAKHFFFLKSIILELYQISHHKAPNETTGIKDVSHHTQLKLTKLLKNQGLGLVSQFIVTIAPELYSLSTFSP